MTDTDQMRIEALRREGVIECRTGHQYGSSGKDPYYNGEDFSFVVCRRDTPPISRISYLGGDLRCYSGLNLEEELDIEEILGYGETEAEAWASAMRGD